MYGSSPLPHLEDGVLLLVLRAVPSRMLPGDLEALCLTVQPDEAGVHTTVYLGHQPRLQTNSPWVQRHCLKDRGDRPAAKG